MDQFWIAWRFVRKAGHGWNFPQEWTIELNLILNPENTRALFKGAWGYDCSIRRNLLIGDAWEKTCVCVCVIWRTHRSHSPLKDKFFLSQRKRNGATVSDDFSQMIISPFRHPRDSPIMHSSVPDEFKPVIFAAGFGACEWWNDVSHFFSDFHNEWVVITQGLHGEKPCYTH